MNRPEILAPAGSFESLTAAVNCGADAVYLGGKALNARRNAGNFDEEELARAVEYCHLHGTKVLQTINIVMFDDELPELLRAAETAARLGIDGAIVQDFGVLSVLKNTVPELPLLASTQMAVHNLAGAREAERLGCRRVVLARELTADEIGHIVSNISAETEVFVHGALCMSVSGQCYLSSMLGGRSGNRGLCAQPCRLPFSVENADHALSLKDLSLIERVRELAELGVRSLKIEGRMKRPEYVAAAVTALRTALDGEAPDMETLRSVFSRSGFTTGYFDGRRTASMFGIRQKEDVTAASGVLGQLAQQAAQVYPRIEVEGAFSACRDEPVSLSLRDCDGNCVFAQGDPPQEARTKPTDKERVRQSLSKTGGTPYRFATLDIDLEAGLMLPVSQINSLRRDAFEQLSRLRSQLHPHRCSGTVPALLPRPARNNPPLLRARCTLSQLSNGMSDCCDELILPLNEVFRALEQGIPAGKIIAEIPRILFEGEDEDMLLLSALPDLGIGRAWAGNLGGAALAREAGLAVCGGWSLNLTNSHALREAREEIGLCDAELSFELALPKAKAVGDPLPAGLVAYGSLPLMAFRNCPVRTRIGCDACGQNGRLTDRKGVSFPVFCRDHRVSELYNAVPLWLADRLGEYAGFSFLTLWFTGESAERCAAVARAYAGKADPAPPAQYTRGLYYRNVP